MMKIGFYCVNAVIGMFLFAQSRKSKQDKNTNKIVYFAKIQEIWAHYAIDILLPAVLRLKKNTSLYWSPFSQNVC